MNTTTQQQTLSKVSSSKLSSLSKSYQIGLNKQTQGILSKGGLCLKNEVEAQESYSNIINIISITNIIIYRNVRGLIR